MIVRMSSIVFNLLPRSEGYTSRLEFPIRSSSGSAVLFFKVQAQAVCPKAYDAERGPAGTESLQGSKVLDGSD
jgi:hypothetical protein